MTSSIIRRAYSLARRSHHGQVRRYNGEPYINHPKAVVVLLESYGISDEATLAAAWLHDVVEDCSVPIASIGNEFGDEVMSIVDALSDPPVVSGGLNRAARKAVDRERLSASCAGAQSIKCADMIDNTSSIVQYDPKFAVVYMREIALLLPLLTKSNRSLWDRADELLKSYQRKVPRRDPSRASK